MINSVVLVGRLGTDPELTYTDSGTAIAKFRLAVSRPPRRGGDEGSGGQDRGEETDWLNVVAFGRQAETCDQYLTKGALVGIEGRIQSRTWERDDGRREFFVEINARRVQFLETRRQREARETAEAAAPSDRGAQPPPPDDLGPGPEEEDPFSDQ